VLRRPERRFLGILYDGFKLQSLFRELIREEESDLSHVHIIFTSRLFGTWDEGDGRYHARVIICGYPSLISTSGIVEAPAMPKEFYHLQQRFAMLGASALPTEMLKKEFQGRFIDYDDKRLSEVMKGYVMQALFYHLFQEPFCSHKKCRLYNAHWQEEVLEAQLGGQEFCNHHQTLLNQLKNELAEE